MVFVSRFFAAACLFVVVVALSSTAGAMSKLTVSEYRVLHDVMEFQLLESHAAGVADALWSVNVALRGQGGPGLYCPAEIDEPIEIYKLMWMVEAFLDAHQPDPDTFVSTVALHALAEAFPCR